MFIQKCILQCRDNLIVKAVEVEIGYICHPTEVFWGPAMHVPLSILVWMYGVADMEGQNYSCRRLKMHWDFCFSVSSFYRLPFHDVYL